VTRSEAFADVHSCFSIETLVAILTSCWMDETTAVGAHLLILPTCAAVANVCYNYYVSLTFALSLSIT
jgi:hypothetical protein